MPRMIVTITSAEAAPWSSASSTRAAEPRGKPCDTRAAAIITAAATSASTITRGSLHDQVVRFDGRSTGRPPDWVRFETQDHCKASLSCCQASLTKLIGASPERNEYRLAQACVSRALIDACRVRGLALGGH